MVRKAGADRITVLDGWLERAVRFGREPLERRQLLRVARE